MRLSVGLLVLALGCSVELEHDLDERTANEVLLELQRAGVAAKKEARAGQGEKGRFAVRVPSGDALRAMDVLDGKALPRGQASGFREVYAKPSLVPSPGEERARYLEALSGELGRTLETIDGVVAARVHVGLPEAEALAPAAGRATPRAAVLLKTTRGAPVDPEQVKRLIAGAVAGLDPAAVSVVAVEAQPRAAAPRLAYVGPIAVEAGSRGALATLIVAALGAVLALGAFLVVTALRHGRLRRKLEELERGRF